MYNHPVYASMIARGVSAAYLAARLNLCPQALRKRLRGEIPWELPEMYTVMKELSVPSDQMALLFPRAEKKP